MRAAQSTLQAGASCLQLALKIKNCLSVASFFDLASKNQQVAERSGAQAFLFLLLPDKRKPAAAITRGSENTNKIQIVNFDERLRQG